MIPLSISSAVLIYLLFSLCIVFYLWVNFERGTAFKKYILEHKEVWTCGICAYTYVDSLHETLSQCPQCKSWNKKNEE